MLQISIFYLNILNFCCGNYSREETIHRNTVYVPVLQRSGRGHPFELTPPGQINSPVPQRVGHVIGQELPSFPVGPFVFLGKKIR